jgi:hypothetical protein
MNPTRKILAVLAGLFLPAGGIVAGAHFGAVVLWDYAETDFPIIEIAGGALMGALLGFLLAVFAIRYLHWPALKVYLVSTGWLPLVLLMGLLGWYISGLIYWSTVGPAILAERIATSTYPLSAGGEIYSLVGFSSGCLVGLGLHIALSVRLWPRRQA